MVMETLWKVASFFREDKDLVMMRQGYTANFFRIFSKGILNYEAGESRGSR